MHIVAAVLALLLLVIVLSPIILQRFRLARRERAVHLDGGCHWYANYDEELRYEPHSRADIVRVSREEVMRRGYRPTDELQIIPRTFRHRVPGDVKIRLWRCSNPEPKALWLCEWAMNPVRVAIGVGERESVPGVESGRVPTEIALAPEPPKTIEAIDWPAGPVESVPSADLPASEELEAALPDSVPDDSFADEVSGVGNPGTGETPDDTEDPGEVEPVEVAGADSSAPDVVSAQPEGRRRTKKRRRRR